MARVGIVAVVGVMLAAGPATGQGARDLAAERRDLMPVPLEVVWRGESLAIDGEFSVSIKGPAGEVEPRLQRAALRMIERLRRQTGVPLDVRIEVDSTAADMRIEYSRAVAEVQSAVEDEAYTLDVAADAAVLRASTPYGVLRGMETFLQLVEVAAPEVAGYPADEPLAAASDNVSAAPADVVVANEQSLARARAGSIADLPPGPADFVVPGVSIRDAPRFPWRGLLIDPGRHFITLDVMKRNLDAMAAVKLNVLHWHLSEDQGFRVESKTFPKLHELGSDGRYYTQDEIRELIGYARDRGIRVMPEFDMPGHATSWFVGYPELASAPGPYEIIERWGIQDPAMDPTIDQTYEFLGAFIAEMTALFPDAYFHIGGDEVNGNQWNANADIQRFIGENELGDNHGLQSYFNRRVQPMLAEHGKRMVGWDEIFHTDLPQDIVIHSWRGQESLAAAARAGYAGILSNGYYIDLVRSAARHYAVDPMAGPAADLTPEERALILGGEATMWGEYVVDETIDSRIWPRTAAIAERLWSPASVTEVDDMYRRLSATSRWLESTGVRHRSGYMPMLERLAGGTHAGPLRVLADVVEPIEGYTRGRTRTYTRFTPLNRLVDAARPESETARMFSTRVSEYLGAVESEGAGTPAASALAAGLRAQLIRWRDNHPALVRLARASTMLPEAEVLSEQLRDVAEAGLAALDDLETQRPATATETAARRAALESGEEQHGALELAIVTPALRLVEAASR